MNQTKPNEFNTNLKHIVGKLSHHIFVKGNILTFNNQEYISLYTKEVDIDYLKSLKSHQDSKIINPFLTSYIIKDNNDPLFVDKIIRDIKYYAKNSSPFLLAPLCHDKKYTKKEEVFYQSGITGTGKPNEDMFMTAQRELFEETGFVIKNNAKCIQILKNNFCVAESIFSIIVSKGLTLLLVVESLPKNVIKSNITFIFSWVHCSVKWLIISLV